MSFILLSICGKFIFRFAQTNQCICLCFTAGDDNVKFDLDVAFVSGFPTEVSPPSVLLTVCSCRKLGQKITHKNSCDSVMNSSNLDDLDVWFVSPLFGLSNPPCSCFPHHCSAHLRAACCFRDSRLLSCRHPY